MLIMLIGIFFLINSEISACNINSILSKAKDKLPEMKKSNVFDHKSFNTSYGSAYTLYYNKKPNAPKAHMVLATVDKNCNIMHISSPAISTFTLKSKTYKKKLKNTTTKCLKKGKIVAENHEFNIVKCGNKYRFEAYGNERSKMFSKREINKIISVFQNTKRSNSYNKQTVYSTNGLKVWVRLYSKSKWFLVFDFDTPNVAGHINAWIPSNKFKEFIKLLK